MGVVIVIRRRNSNRQSAGEEVGATAQWWREGVKVWGNKNLEGKKKEEKRRIRRNEWRGEKRLKGERE